MAGENTNIVDSVLVGEVWPAAAPAEDPVLYGQAQLSPDGAFEVRSYQTFTLTYTVGRFGLDDNGSIRVVFRFFGDWGGLQMEDPAAPNYVTAITSLGTKPSLNFQRIGHSRPWMKALTAGISGGYLSEGDTITITFGDTSSGSPGFKMQTFVESGFEFKVLVDACAVGHYVPIMDKPAISIVPGPPAEWRATLPTLRRPNETFQLGIKAEDTWGNPSDQVEAELRLEPSLPVKNLPAAAAFNTGQKSLVFENLSVAEEGDLRIRVINAESDDLLSEAGPLIIEEGKYGGYWGDLHGQSGETIGITNSREYFDFARDLAFLDVISHQANDFQVNNAFWEFLNELTAAYNNEGRFVTFPGYEWSGNTSVGGDRNIYFREEGRQIRRSSHALLPDQSDIHTDANDARELFAALKDEDCLAYAHVGGRYADIEFAHDATIETAMEIHSAWGTFEWLLTDGFPLGHRSGVVCNSDGHKGRPGASYPGASMFGAYGGLTCFYTEELSRDGIFDCLKKRHHYGTTGNRLHLTVDAEFKGGGKLFDRDPNVYDDATSSDVTSAMMGDIVQTDDANVTVKVVVNSPTPIERIEIRNGTEVVETLRGYTESDLGNRYRVIWSGAEYRGRGRNTSWLGEANFKNANITRMEKINAWNHERLLEVDGDNKVKWDAITTGNYGGFDVWLENVKNAEISIETNHGSLACPLAEMGIEDTVLDCGGLERRLKLMRLPEQNPHRELTREVEIILAASGDNPLWVCVTTEDGFQAWSSPIFVFN
tara:strand:+ start:3921 stop:6224 length:2304 start_codon:yes stop_codon:yes gene_type:complete